MKVWLNNKIVSMKEAKVSVFDRGFLYGDGVFETMRSYGGIVFKLDEHLDRLYDSLKITQIRLPYPKSFLKGQIYRLLKVNKIKDAYIRLTVTRGVGTVGLARIICKKPTVLIVAKRFIPYPKKMYESGIKVKIVKVSQNENSPISRIKSTSFLNYILARLEAKKSGFDDAIMLNSDNKICESTISNLFLIKGKQLVTPPLKSGPLPGITRKVILALSSRVGLAPREREVSVRELYNADEIFLTNSLMEVMPVVKIDSKFVGGGNPGPAIKRIHEEYRRLVS
jgi:branched-chain amino acid aminotransferase